MEQGYCPYCMSSVGAGGRCPECGHARDGYVPPPHHLPPGTTLSGGRYVTGRAIGHGGFGITYIGFDRTLRLRVAIKEYFPDGWVNATCSSSFRITLKDKFRTGNDLGVPSGRYFKVRLYLIKAAGRGSRPQGVGLCKTTGNCMRCGGKGKLA